MSFPLDALPALPSVLESFIRIRAEERASISTLVSSQFKHQTTFLSFGLLGSSLAILGSFFCDSGFLSVPLS